MGIYVLAANTYVILALGQANLLYACDKALVTVQWFQGFCLLLLLQPSHWLLCLSRHHLVCLRVNKRGEPMLTNMNMTSHQHYDGVYY